MGRNDAVAERVSNSLSTLSLHSPYREREKLMWEDYYYATATTHYYCATTKHYYYYGHDSGCGQTEGAVRFCYS